MRQSTLCLVVSYLTLIALQLALLLGALMLTSLLVCAPTLLAP